MSTLTRAESKSSLILSHINYSFQVQIRKRLFQRKHIRPIPSVQVTFYINPQDQTLDLAKKEHLKLYSDACLGIKDKDKCFNGNPEYYDDFLKLIVKNITSTRVEITAMVEIMNLSSSYKYVGKNLIPPLRTMTNLKNDFYSGP